MTINRHIGVAIVCALAFSAALGTAQAQVSEKVLYSFTGGLDGAGPAAPLLIDMAGGSGKLRGLYSAADYGGVDGDGTAFELLPPHGGSKAWTESTLWGFTGGSDGAYPGYGALFSSSRKLDSNATLYGTTLGGANGYGTVFSLQGTSLTPIYAFTGGQDGGSPDYGVVSDNAGALYTATSSGGSGGCGTIVQLVPPSQGQTAWTENTIYSFSGSADGCTPNSVIIDRRGILYGTTLSGGTINSYCSSGCGTAFALLPPDSPQTVWTQETLWSFQGGLDGAASYTPLTFGQHGVLFGTTSSGGNANCSLYSGCGTVFELTPPARGGTAWTEQVIAAFSPTGSNSVPYAGLLIDKSGALYGTASGTSPANGSIYRVNPPPPGQTAWTLEPLFDFPGGRSGSYPLAPVTADRDGVLYGTTFEGGMYYNGVVFSLSGTGFVAE